MSSGRQKGNACHLCGEVFGASLRNCIAMPYPSPGCSPNYLSEECFTRLATDMTLGIPAPLAFPVKEVLPQTPTASLHQC
jgi:hypothetical protein